MALQVIAQLKAQLVNVPGGQPSDVESDTNAATQGTLNVLIPNQGGTFAFLTVEPVAESVLAALANGACTVVISQGAGTLSVTTTQ
jgi:hypothetical protein